MEEILALYAVQLEDDEDEVAILRNLVFLGAHDWLPTLPYGASCLHCHSSLAFDPEESGMLLQYIWRCVACEKHIFCVDGPPLRLVPLDRAERSARRLLVIEGAASLRQADQALTELKEGAWHWR